VQLSASSQAAKKDKARELDPVLGRFLSKPVAWPGPSFTEALRSLPWLPRLKGHNGSHQTGQRKTCADPWCQP
jgi:hypothetical protein